MTNCTCIIGIGVLIGASCALAGDCVISDDFNDNNPSPLWEIASTSPGNIGIQEANNRIGFWANSNNFTNMIASGLSNGWKIDMTQDWSIEGRWHISGPAPSPDGDSGIVFAVLLEGDPGTAYIKDGVTLHGGRTYDPSVGILDYEIALKWNEGTNEEYNFGPRDSTESMVYVWYLASIDTLLYNNKDDISTALSVPNIHSVSPATTEAWIGFGVYSYGVKGSVPAFTSNNYWADDFCLRSGNVVGSSVGACCTVDECSLTLSQFCSGTFMGPGSDCDSCKPECECDLDGSGHVGVDDLLLIISAWGACSNCPEDFTGDNRVGVDDLLLVIAAWGPCS